jgi:uncharacterized membrane protein
MTILILYVVTVLVFLALDAVMLTRFMKPLFEGHIGHLMLAEIRIVPAALFYLAFIAGVVWLVSLPALREGAPLQALIGGAVIGAMAYGTYEFTSYAIMKDWHPSMVVADVAWGAVLTGFSAWAGVAVTRLLTA